MVAAQDYQEYRQAPLRIGTKAEEPKPTPVPILKQINSDRSGYYRKRCFTAVRNNCKLRPGANTHSKFIPSGPATLNRLTDGGAGAGATVAAAAPPPSQRLDGKRLLPAAPKKFFKSN
ncbi:hypothetical protein AND_003731 [Anopheles darlingi]|uniref:Uncharacterized protein n=1 Tax=Anopheles darlingi TaxID=43151 RepID=W5JK78_ANODA|nr:hypothetical protein AND_003731 [Anopheles darlingi]